MKDNNTEELKKKLDAIQLRLDKGESIEKIIDDTFRNTSTPDIIFAVSERQARIFDKEIKKEVDRLYGSDKPKLDGTQLTLEFKEDF